MKNLLKRKTEELEAMRDIAGDVQESEFVPYACHIDPHTILTKNGELLQVLKLVGFTYENTLSQRVELRHALREGLTDALHSTDYAVWIHTIRRKASLTPQGQYPNDFSLLLNTAWRELNDWDHQFTNEVYVTIVKEGDSAEITQPMDFFRGLYPPKERSHRWGVIDEALDQLTDTVERLMEHLLPFGVKKLGTVERQGVVYSEPVTFLHKLTTLVDDPLPLPDLPLDHFLTGHEVTFGFNAMEVRTVEGKRRFGGLLSLKEYRELPAPSIDLLLQLPIEFIISQCMDFINPKKALKEYLEQKEIFDLSEEADLPEATGLTDMLESDHHQPVDFGEQQLTFFILGDSVKHLEESVRRMVSGLNGLGLLAVREDIKFEECYWSLLPANFEFLRRLKPINTSRIGGFAQLNNLPSGLARGSIWGPPVTLLHTAIGTPYFFNFHVEQNGHMAIIGPLGAGKTVMLNFLLSEARKFQNRLYFFDRHRHAEIFLRSLGATYYTIDARIARPGEELDRPVTLTLPKLNPLQLEDTPQNRSFLLVWLDAMIRTDKFYRPEMSDECWPSFQQAVEHVFTLPKEERQIRNLIAYLRQNAPRAAAKLYPWYADGAFANWFDHPEDELDLSAGLTGFELAPLMTDPNSASPVIAYLLHRVMLMLDGKPTIIVLDEAWELLDNPVFASRLGGWLEMLRSRNAMVIMATEKPEDALHSRLSPMIMQQLAAQIYLPNPQILSEEYTEIFGLTLSECRLVAMMDKNDRQFMLKRGAESIVLELDLSRLAHLLPILSADRHALRKMDKLLQEYGESPTLWIQRFIQQLKEGSA
jgi:type IV secretion system protein VirB4